MKSKLEYTSKPALVECYCKYTVDVRWTQCQKDAKHIRILYFSVNIYDNWNVPGELGSEGTLSSLGREPALARDL